MAKYIKSHSNYRLSSKHQDTQNGTILERDISTVGGVDSFANGQSTIYSSGNFVITINNESSASRHILKKGWLSNSESGETWNAEVLENYTSDVNGSVEEKITVNNDFMDLRSFACYGSLYNLIQTSIADIIDKFPYEIYTGDGTQEKVSYYSGVNAYEIFNPANIDIHSNYVQESDSIDKLKYFSNGGSDNYSLIIDTDKDCPAEGYNFSWSSTCENEYSVSLKSKETNYTLNGNFHNYTLKFAKATELKTITYNGKSYKLNNDGSSITFDRGDVLYVRYKNNNLELSKKYCPETGDYVATVILIYKNTQTIKIVGAIDNNLQIKYLISGPDLGKDSFNCHIRPKESLSFYDNYIDSLTIFEKCLLGVYSGKKNVAKFEVLSENEQGMTKTLQSFTFPSAEGDYNLSSDGEGLSLYIQTLARIGLYYDDIYTDNMYRLMTHESLKNFDWTRNFNGNDTEDNEYVTSGEKFKSVIRIMGYVFDKEKTYIDCISNTNTITYNNRSNLPDYFLTDSLNVDGWITKTIYPLNLKEIDKITQEENTSDWAESSQTANYYTRQFSENTTDIITPYDHEENEQIWSSVEKKMIDVDAEGSSTYIENGCVKNVISNYYDNVEYTIPDVSNNFMKRLRINSRHILRKKGTIDGIESLLSLFGYRSKKWFTSLPIETQERMSENLSSKTPFDFDIEECTEFTAPIEETWDDIHKMYKTDFYNSCKTISYNTQSYLNGEYIQYQGLPIAYRDIDGSYLTSSGVTTNPEEAYQDENGNSVLERRLYPNFDNNGIYDGDTYYQMYGGWLNYWPYMYDANDECVPNKNGDICKETLRNVKQVNNLQQLISQSVDNLDDGIIYFVNDLSTNYGVIDGSLYELHSEVGEDDNTYYYFKLIVNNGMIVVGNVTYDSYVVVSTPYTDEGTVTYNITYVEDGTEIRVYYTGDDNSPFYISGYDSITYTRLEYEGSITREVECDADDEGAMINYENITTPETINIFINGAFDNNTDDATNYFKLESMYYAYLVGSDGWNQLTKTDYDYLKISGIEDNYEGNNPHSGGYGYDSGHEYLYRFTKLFKYPLENNMFNETCFINPSEAYDEIESIGFSGLTSNNESTKDYNQYLHTDTKVHAFCDVLNSGVTESVVGKYNHTGELYLHKYYINNVSSISSKTGYSYAGEVSNADGVTSQIVNTKIININFYTQCDGFYTKECQEELKYLQNVVMPYVEQILPSTIIARVRIYIPSFTWIMDADENGNNEGAWKDKYWTLYGKWKTTQN